MKVIFVGFMVRKDRAVMYKKMDIDLDSLNYSDEKQAMRLGKLLLTAIEKACDFVSIRFVGYDS